MTARDLALTLGFVEVGTALCKGAIGSLDEAAFDAATPLPGWTRRHLVAHLASDAEAIGRLLHWASTGERTPMYASAEQRASDLEGGTRLSGAELSAWFDRSAQVLDERFAAMTAEGRSWPSALPRTSRSSPASCPR